MSDDISDLTIKSNSKEKITSTNKEKDITKLIAPILMTTAGLFGWAIRGQAGFGGPRGCIFAGLIWGITWYLLSKEKPNLNQNGVKSFRRYNMGWTIFALTIGIGISGLQGWGDITALVRGTILVNEDPITIFNTSPAWGYFYFFFLGFHWVGTGALFLAWSGSKESIDGKVWLFRIISCIIGVTVLFAILNFLPQLILPDYAELGNYDFSIYPNLEDLYQEITECFLFTGFVLGGLVYEIIRKDWMNVKVILIPSIFTGLSWMFLITLWEIWVSPWAALNGVSFNWWRCWESTGGGALGLGLGLTFILCNKKLNPDDKNQRNQRFSNNPNGEKLIGVYLTITLAIAYSTFQSITGWMHIFQPTIPELDTVLIGYTLPVVMIFLMIWIGIVLKTIQNPHTPNDEKDITPNYSYVYFFIYILTRILGLQVTWALEYSFSELAFFIYYIVLACFDLTLVIVWMKKSNILDENYIKNIKNFFIQSKT